MEKKKDSVESFMRESELINKLREIGGEESADAAKAFLSMSDFEQRVLCVILGLSRLAKNQEFMKEGALLIPLLNIVLEDETKKLLMPLFGLFVREIIEALVAAGDWKEDDYEPDNSSECN